MRADTRVRAMRANGGDRTRTAEARRKSIELRQIRAWKAGKP